MDTNLQQASWQLDLAPVEERPTEFPRIDNRLVGRPHRYLTVVANSGRGELTRGEHDHLVWYDMASGISRVFDWEAVVGEVVFGPRAGATEELDGYYLAFATPLDAGRSARFLVCGRLHSSRPPARPGAHPQRVPNGLHGNWFAAGSPAGPPKTRPRG